MQQIQIGFQAIANVLETREKWLQVCFHSSIGLKVKPAVKWKVTDIKGFPNLWPFSIILPLALQVVLCKESSSFSAR